jgi:outer membrane murein-binding lipoprotein Lpp
VIIMSGSGGGGSGGGNRPATDAEKGMVIALIALAGAIFAGLLSLFNAVLATLSHTGQEWATVVSGLIFAFLTASIILGGRGYGYGPKTTGFFSRFNLQAVTGLIGVILTIFLLGIIFYTTEPSANEKFAGEIAGLKTQIADMSKKFDAAEHNVSSLETEVAGVKSDVKALNDKVGAAQTLAASVDRASGGFSSDLSAIAGALKELSDAVHKLETEQHSPAQQ